MELDRTILKKLWNGEKVLCPKCNEDYLIPLHKKKNSKSLYFRIFESYLPHHCYYLTDPHGFLILLFFINDFP